MRVALGTSTGNMFVYEITNIGENFEDCRNLETVTLLEPTQVIGSPTLSNITFVQFFFDTIAALPASSVRIDHMQAFTG